MKNRTLKIILVSLFAFIPFVAQASFLGIATSNDLKAYQQKIEFINYQLEQINLKLKVLEAGGSLSETLGAATQTIAGTTYSLAGSGISSSATSITLTSLTIPQTGYALQDSDLSTTFYITLEPGSRTRQEVASCTTVTQNGNGTATLSGCVRGLLPYSPYTTSSTYAFAHGGGTSVVFSDPPQLYEEFAAVGNNARISGVWTFASSTLPRASSTPTYTSGDELKFVTYGQLASTSFSGTVDGSETQKGIFELGTIAETAAGTSAGGTTAPLIPQNKYFNATSTATTTIPVTRGTGKLDSNFIDQTATYSWSGTSTFSGVSTTTFNTKTLHTATSTFASSTIFQVIPTIPSSTPSNVTDAASKNYVDSRFGFINTTSTTAFSITSLTNLATSTFTLANAGRVLVNVAATAINSVDTDGCKLTLYVDGADQDTVGGGNHGLGAMTQSGAVIAYGNVGFTFITASLTAAAHTLGLRGANEIGGNCNFTVHQFATTYIGT